MYDQCTYSADVMSQHFRRIIIDSSYRQQAAAKQLSPLLAADDEKQRADYRLAAAGSKSTVAKNRDTFAKNVCSGARKSGPIDKDLIIRMQMVTR